MQDTPIASTAKDTVILTWWLARQIVAGGKVTGRSVDWQSEIALAERILLNQEKVVCQVVKPCGEELVSPSICSDGEKTYQTEPFQADVCALENNFTNA